MYESCGEYLRKEVSILQPDVIVTQGNTVHDKSEKYVFDVIKKRPVQDQDISDADSRAYIVRLKEGKRRVYWLKLYFPYGRFYSQNHAGPAIDSESDGIENRGKKRKNLVLYGKDIKEFMDEEGR